MNLDDVENLPDSMADVKVGLIVSEKGANVQVPLQEVHIRGKIMDMVAEVNIWPVGFAAAFSSTLLTRKANCLV